MNPIAIKHKGYWPDTSETYILDQEKVRYIVFHRTMFFDDEEDVYGVIETDGAEHWITTHCMNRADYDSMSGWLKEYFGFSPDPPNDDEGEPPIVVWPEKYRGDFYFENSFLGKMIENLRLFPGCYEKRTISADLR